MFNTGCCYSDIMEEKKQKQICLQSLQGCNCDLFFFFTFKITFFHSWKRDNEKKMMEKGKEQKQTEKEVRIRQ